ncbi:hypothetical protein ASPWEDRAFT_442980 [Aspergillus wentii DTO 134E9]|uniref:Uncharacterized protein n=1 Tax=Aspergillus wentii DTO 134E9 TaxID=1073089 RepID=A0A1L9RQH8_ASPWE|nr:uncharacterized protein ASPWEDRAFT_442980 [Aspergillus wentii DTO 134E9]KAI9928326.1 hypothetical protein MW887_002364 [Aspergillus wentii]OJJ37191.1 hypothetical protein ASPWEDRAFT_442980 [Aspergillus wentii DTO 134E9]
MFSIFSQQAIPFKRRMRSRWPPKPFVEDELQSLSRELHGLSRLGETPGLEAVCARGTLEQYPVIIDVPPPPPSTAILTPSSMEDLSRGNSSDESVGPPTPLDVRKEPLFYSVDSAPSKSPPWPVLPTKIKSQDKTPSRGRLPGQKSHPQPVQSTRSASHSQRRPSSRLPTSIVQNGNTKKSNTPAISRSSSQSPRNTPVPSSATRPAEGTPIKVPLLSAPPKPTRPKAVRIGSSEGRSKADQNPTRSPTLTSTSGSGHLSDSTTSNTTVNRKRPGQSSLSRVNEKASDAPTSLAQRLEEKLKRRQKLRESGVSSDLDKPRSDSIVLRKTKPAVKLTLDTSTLSQGSRSRPPSTSSRRQTPAAGYVEEHDPFAASFAAVSTLVDTLQDQSYANESPPKPVPSDEEKQTRSRPSTRLVVPSDEEKKARSRSSTRLIVPSDDEKRRSRSSVMLAAPSDDEKRRSRSTIRHIIPCDDEKRRSQSTIRHIIPSDEEKRRSPSLVGKSATPSEEKHARSHSTVNRAVSSTRVRRTRSRSRARRSVTFLDDTAQQSTSSQQDECDQPKQMLQLRLSQRSISSRDASRQSSRQSSPVSRQSSPVSRQSSPISRQPSPTPPGLCLLPCPRSIPVAGHQDWYTIKGLTHLDICPSCTSQLDKSEFRDSFIPSGPKPRGQMVRCSFSEPWTRLAWVQTIKKHHENLDMLYHMTRPSTERKQCPGRTISDQHWYRVIDPSTGMFLPKFNVCSACIRNLRVLMPSHRDSFKRSTEMQERVCDFVSDSPRFIQYIDYLDMAANRAVSEGASQPDLDDFLTYARRKVVLRDCRRDRVVLSTWHYMRQLPELTVCEDCYDDVVWPLVKAKQPIARKFSTSMRLLPGEDPTQCGEASCQLYSPRTRAKFREAVQKNDLTYLKLIGLRRYEAEQRFRDRRQQLVEEQRLGYDCDAEFRENMEEWKKWE